MKTKMNKTVLYLICVVLVASSHLAGQISLTAAQIQQQLQAQPPQAITYQFQKAAAHGLNLPIEVKQYVQADFDGTGAFNYIVALYGLGNRDGSYLRAFKVQGNSLVLAGDEEDHRGVGGYGAVLTLIDLQGNGTPTVMVTAHSSGSPVEEFFNLYAWTGSSLHNMLPNLTSYGNLVDLNGDGVLEIVYPPLCGDNGCSSGYDVYQLVGNEYKFWKNFAQDPSGQTGANGQIQYVRAFCTRLEPHRFRLDEITDALHHHGAGNNDDRNGTVKLKFGGLDRVNVGPVDVNLVDTTSILVAPNLTPVRVRVFSVGEKDQDHDQGADDKNDVCHKMDSGRILVEVSREDFLRGLQRLHLTGPLAAGDHIEVKLTAKLKDGTPVGATLTAKIVGTDRDTNKQH